MLEVELDIFSGMPNPTWRLSHEDEKRLVDAVLADSSQISPVIAPDENLGLGFRGYIVRQIKTDDGPWSRTKPPNNVTFANVAPAVRGALPALFRVGTKPARQASAADLLLRTAERSDSQVTDALRSMATQGVQLAQVAYDNAAPIEGPEATSFGASTQQEVGIESATWWACNSAYYSANASYFNDPAHVTKNNCYCFGSNHLADIRYALPGKRGGRPAQFMTCGSVIDGLRADGWVDGCQTNTLTIAMVIWPNNDYHFYRVVTSGPAWWWGHKPGGTPAKYTDNSGRPINLTNNLAPNNCDRGPYSDFCGYFYQNNATAFVA